MSDHKNIPHLPDDSGRRQRMKLGDIVVYTPPSHPETDGKPRYVVVGVIPETQSDNEQVWLSGISNTEVAPEPASCDEALDYTSIEVLDVVEDDTTELDEAAIAALTAERYATFMQCRQTGHVWPASLRRTDDGGAEQDCERCGTTRHFNARGDEMSFRFPPGSAL